MASPDLSLRIDQTAAIAPKAETDLGLAYVGHTGSSLSVVSGLSVANALGYGGFGNDSFVNNAIKASGGGLVPQTLGTAVYQKIHLVAGTKLIINSTFTPGDKAHNDESFALLKNLATGDITQRHIANVNDVISSKTQNYTTTFDITTTGDYNLMVGVADIGDKLHPSSLTINAISNLVPGGNYTVLPSGLQLADNSLLRTDGSLQIGSTLQPGVLASSSLALLAGLSSLLANKLISQDGGGLISQDGGGIATLAGVSIVSHDAGGIVSHDAGGVVSNDGSSLLSPSAGLINGASLAQITSNLASFNAASIRAFSAASTAGLTGGHNYGLMSLDGDTDPVPDSGGGTPSTVPVPGLEVNASSGAVANRYDDASAVADLGGGKYVVAFTEYSQDPTTFVKTYAIRAQIINADGSTSGAELTASPALPGTTIYGTSANVLSSPSVASLGGGAFVVAWENGSTVRPGASGGFSTGADLFAQAFNADGSARGGLISLDAGTTDAQYTDVKVAALSGGGFVAVWAQQDTPSGSASIHGKLFNADGTQHGSEFSISGSAVLADLRLPAVTALANGGFAVSFQGKTTDPSTGSVITGIAAQRYTADGAALLRNPAIIAISDTQKLQESSLAALPNGNLAVAWFDVVGPGASPALYSLVLGPDLVPQQTAPTLVSGTATAYYGNPSVTALSDGRFVVGYTASGTTLGVEAQIMAGDNTTVGAPFAVYAAGGGDADSNGTLLQLGTGTLIAASTHKFYYLPGSDVRALPIDLGGSSTSAPTTASHALASGSAVHGYVAGGTVFADANGNGVLDPGEASATTTADGVFALSPDATGSLVLTGGTDLATGKAFTGRYTAPAGSHAINALTTLIQGVLARGADIGTAQFKVATALGMAADAELTNLDPMTAAAQSSETGRAVLLANALIADIADLATAAGSPDAIGSFAASIAAQGGFTAFDPSSTTALAAAGLSGQVLTDASAIAASIKALLTAKGVADGSNPTQLAADVNRVEVVVQSGAAPDFAAAIGTGTTSAVAAAYTGANLDAKFDAAATGPITRATLGVYRFFDANYGTHFFTNSTSERDSILSTRPDLVSEGVVLQAVDPASNDPNAAAVYRFFDTKFGTHFFTASAAERDQVIAGRPDLAFEGTGFYEHTTQQAGDVAVYRFFDTKFGTHFYTSDAGERAGIVATRNDLVDEGIGFYAPKG